MAKIKNRISFQALLGSGVATLVVLAFSFSWFQVLGAISPSQKQEATSPREIIVTSNDESEAQIRKPTGQDSDSQNPSSTTSANSDSITSSPQPVSGFDQDGVNQPGDVAIPRPDQPPGPTDPDQPGNPTVPVFEYCSGDFPDVPDGVCKAVLSIEIDPTADNPHVGGDVAGLMSLMPPGTQVTLHEDTWIPYSDSVGDISLTAHVPGYGDIFITVGVHYEIDIWVMKTLDFTL